MFEQQLIQVAIGLAIIIPIVLFLRWFLGKSVGSPEEWVQDHIKELERRYANGEIDEEAYRKRLEELKRR